MSQSLSLTLGVHAPEGYSTCLCVCVCVCLSVTTLAAASFISMLEIRHEQLYYGNLLIFNVWIFIKCFVQKLWRHLLTATVSGAIAAILSSFFRRQRLFKVVSKANGRLNAS